jgi:beta-lactam-binding protein with PASTA domain
MSKASIIFTSIFTSFITSVVTYVAIEKYDILPLAKEVTVPKLEGLSEDDARLNLKAAGLSMIIGDRIQKNDVPPDTVVNQKPFPGAGLPQGQAVTVSLSESVPMAQVPNLLSTSLAAATIMLEQKGFKIQTGETVPHESIPEGSIAKQVPVANTAFEKGRTVTIQLSSGPGTINVPQFTNMLLGDAKKAVKKSGFKLAKIKWSFNEDREPFIVLKQSPQKGEQAMPGSEIQLHVNSE